jgi:hypothetical protein
MDTYSNPGTAPPATGRGRGWSPVWYGIGAVVFAAIIVVLFFVFGSASIRHEYYGSPQPGGTAAPKQTGTAPVIPD